MIAGKNIHKKYGTVEILKGVDIEIQKGEVVSIVGPSGSGKSTLLHILGTLDHPDNGHIEIHGTRIEFQPRVDINPAPWYKRLLNFIIDLAIISAVTLGLSNVLNIPLISEAETGIEGSMAVLDWTQFLLIGLILLGYYILFETFLGRTPGKFATGTRVMKEEVGTKPGFLSSFIRSVSRFIPFEVFSFFSHRPTGWHDSLAGTVVTDTKIPYLQKTANSLTRSEMAIFRNKRIGFVFQFHHLLPEFTALENVCIPGWLAGRKKAEVIADGTRLLNMLGLSHRLGNKPNELSGGEQQRVAVARALINKPDIVFADEPTGNLDSANAEELHRIFFDLRKEFSQTFLIVTHNEELARLSDRVLHMKDGKIV